jgi:hypothetical protein
MDISSIPSLNNSQLVIYLIIDLESRIKFRQFIIKIYDKGDKIKRYDNGK